MKIARLSISASLVFCAVITAIARPKDLPVSGKVYYHTASSNGAPILNALEDDTKAVILNKAKEQLRKYFLPDSCRISVAPRWVPSQLLQVKAKNITEVEIKGRVQHYTNFEVLYNQNHRMRRVEIQLALEVRKKMPITVHRLRADQKITEEDFAYQWVSIFKYNSALIDDIGKLRGKVLKRTLLSGQPIRSAYISREYLVKSGDQVEMYLRRKGFVVQVSGEARESGAKGDEIRIYNKDTRRKYMAEVVSRGVVIWKKTL